MVVGLTGGIACGKSTVSQIFIECGAALVDADLIAHQVVEPKKTAWQKIVERFGEEILLPTGEIDRPKLGGIVFRDPGARKDLEEITHPQIRRESQRQVNEAQERSFPLVIVDVPLLIEGGSQNRYEKVILVYIDARMQIKRLMERDALTRDQAMDRIHSQMPIEEKRKYADYIIDNSGTKEETVEQVRRLYQKLISGEKET